MQEIGIIVAMDEEREAILKIMTDTKVEQIYNLRFLRGKIQGKNCILVKSGSKCSKDYPSNASKF